MAFGSGKRKVNVISEEDMNHLLAEEEMKAQVVRDKELDELKALKETFDLLDAEKRNAVEIEASK